MTTTLTRSSRIEGMGVSSILLLAQTAREMKAQGLPVIDMSAGQPDFETPDHVKQAAIDAIASGQTRYTALDGTEPMKAAIRHKFSSQNGLEFKPDEVMACAGAKQALFNALMASINTGDEIILPTPCWLSYFDIVKVTGGVPVSVCGSQETGYKITPDQLQQVITPRSRWIWFNSPNNPSGAVYSANELEALLAVVEQYPNLWVIADDVYEHIRFDTGRFATPASVRPDLRSRILTVNAVSKAYAMTGWRLGYCGGNSELLKAMAIVQSQSTTNPCSISQAAAVAALTGSQEFLKNSQSTYARRRDTLYKRLSQIEGIEGNPPQGSFFAFVRISGLLNKKTPDGKVIDSDSALSRYLLNDANVVTVPGSEFGMPEHLRISFAVTKKDIEIAVDRVKTAIDALQ